MALAAPKLDRLSAWDGYVPEWMEENGAAWLSRGPRLYRADALGAAPQHKASVPLASWKRLAGAADLGRRLLRLSFYAVIPRPDELIFVAFNRTLGILNGGSFQPIEGLAKSFRILRGGAALAPSGAIYFGEYIINADRKEPINIYRLPPGSLRAEIVHTFKPGEIRHVHSVRWDAISSKLWICCGDLPNECRILACREDFATIEIVGAGDESWRAIQPLFLKGSVYYATDAEFESNAIYRFDRSDGSRQLVTKIDGPSYYGGQYGQQVVYGTTAELCPSQTQKAAELWTVGPDTGVLRLGVFRKDLFGLRALVPIFQPGLVLFPAGAVSQSLVLTGMGLKGLSGKAFVLRAL